MSCQRSPSRKQQDNLTQKSSFKARSSKNLVGSYFKHIYEINQFVFNLIICYLLTAALKTGLLLAEKCICRQNTLGAYYTAAVRDLKKAVFKLSVSYYLC
jgi:hypothetical protein